MSAASRASRAVVADPFELNDDVALVHRARRLAGRDDLHGAVRKARHDAAIRADEVRMLMHMLLPLTACVIREREAIHPVPRVHLVRQPAKRAVSGECDWAGCATS